MNLQPDTFAQALADPTRLRLLALLRDNRELCVCELTAALDIPQPKISRHLAVLRKSSLLLDRRAGQWIHYRLHPEMPAWAAEAIAAVLRGCIGKEPYATDNRRLGEMTNAGCST